MSLKENIYKLRCNAHLTQAEFAEKFGVSHQAVQKWESGETKPDLENVMKIAKVFGVSTDFLLLDASSRALEELPVMKAVFPSYEKSFKEELYSEILDDEYQQCIDEGLDIAQYRDLFECISRMEPGKTKVRLADICYDIIMNAPQVKDYPYVEPSEADAIKRCRKPNARILPAVDKGKLKEKIAGAWYGRICGCLLGKPLEGIRTDELIPFLKQSGNYPMHRYLHTSDITDEVIQSYRHHFPKQFCADAIIQAPSDDDTNYTVLYQKVIDEHGRDFTPHHVSRIWMALQPKTAYCTAERIAFRNFVNHYAPPASAVYQNPFREWIGAQIRADYFGYINPGNPELAADMAWRDACISHVKNGIYGEMFTAAMIAAAAVLDDIEAIIEEGLAQIPEQSRLYEAIDKILSDYRSGVSCKKCFAAVHTEWDEHNRHHWCHTISNAQIVVASLLYGANDYGKSICLAVQTGFDTDCNGATVGSVLGMKNGFSSIGNEWISPVNGKLETSIVNMAMVDIEQAIEKTLEHI